MKVWGQVSSAADLEFSREAVTKIAVTDPNKLAPDQIAPALLELGARLISDHIGEAVSPDAIRLLIEHTPNILNQKIAEANFSKSQKSFLVISTIGARY